MKERLRIAVVDDHPLFREGVVRSLSELGFAVVGEGAGGEDAIQLVQSQRPDILLMDISMPGGGIEAISPILKLNPAQKIVMLTVSETLQDAAAAFRSGASGYVLKGVGAKDLAQILRTIAQGQTYMPAALSARLIATLASSGGHMRSKGDLLETLTNRETQILEAVAQGLSNKHVARRLDLHEKTIKHHMTSILAKLNVSNRTEAAIFFREVRRER